MDTTVQMKQLYEAFEGTRPLIGNLLCSLNDLSYQSCATPTLTVSEILLKKWIGTMEEFMDHITNVLHELDELHLASLND